MLSRLIFSAPVAALSLAVALAIASISQPLQAAEAARRDGVVTVQSHYAFDETVARLKPDIASKGITFFAEIDQARLGAEAGLPLKPSTLLIFGNPPLGIQFLTAKPTSGLDWPVRLLVYQDESGTVWTAYSDFGWIARRHGIGNRKAQFEMASKVVGSITSSVTAK